VYGFISLVAKWNAAITLFSWMFLNGM